MQALKGGIIVIFGLFIMITLISLLIPSKIITARAVSVQADSLRMFDELSDLKKWKNWHPVFISDSANITYSEVSNEVGSYAKWTTNNVENTLLMSSKNYPSVSYLLKRTGENDLENTFTIMRVQEQGNMQVQWQSINRLKWYPWEKFSGIFIEKLSGAGLDEALQSFKKNIEN